ncbi:MAG: septum formation initiator family protein [Candidatus Chlorobium antarcticum]|nr:septum formation initiator family protein [Candidatus Chlorobium antarcticum]
MGTLNAIIQRVWEYVRSNPKKLIAIVAVVIVAAVMLFDDYGLWRRASMEAENRRLLDVQAQAERRMVENELRIRNVGNPDSVEKAARERYNFRREGERLYIIKK